jgi:hypothetical protein
LSLALSGISALAALALVELGDVELLVEFVGA